MKRWLVILVCAAVMATLSYMLTRRLLSPGEEDQLTWLQREFQLSSEQITTISQLQNAYAPICAEHCRLIQQARQQAQSDAAELARLERVCQEATLKHLREIAAVMHPAEGRRFLALVEPKISRHEHQGPLGLK